MVLTQATRCTNQQQRRLHQQRGSTIWYCITDVLQYNATVKYITAGLTFIGWCCFMLHCFFQPKIISLTGKGKWTLGVTRLSGGTINHAVVLYNLYHHEDALWFHISFKFVQLILEVLFIYQNTWGEIKRGFLVLSIKSFNDYFVLRYVILIIMFNYMQRQPGY